MLPTARRHYRPPNHSGQQPAVSTRSRVGVARSRLHGPRCPFVLGQFWPQAPVSLPDLHVCFSITRTLVPMFRGCCLCVCVCICRYTHQCTCMHSPVFPVW